ncbi:MAG: type IA DNA topoisomerase [Thermofilum sp.]|nr:type IA DNA topoisomerase [Thermofilum sp.]
MQFARVIVAEKPGVARAFALYLSGGRYELRKVAGVPVYVFKQGESLHASVGVRGHLMDFDFPREYNSWRRVDPLELFEVEPVRVVREGMENYVKALQALARSTDTVILALDADVEGEAIAFEVMDVMRRVNPRLRFLRAWFSAVTREDIIDALRNLRAPNANLANKAFARMVLDLTIGAAFTRTLTLIVEKRGALPRGRFLSYGPCQTPVLYLVVKRAIERENFQKKKFFQISATVRIGRYQLKMRHDLKYEKREDAERVARELLRARNGLVTAASYVKRIVEPPEPLATVEMERRASRFLNIRAKRAMDIAEDLYQEGLISYPRTDTTIYPPTLNLRAIAAKFAAHEELGEYVRKVILSAPQLRVRQGKESDGAHPPIYPLRYASRDEVVKRFGLEGWKLYDLVVRHFLATLSPPMVVEDQSVEVEIARIKLKAEGLKVLEPGYTIVYPFERPQESALPHVERGAQAEVLSVKVVEAETRPPPYLSEAELLRLMRKYGIGTDATMQDHIHTNVERNYFKIVRKQCIPTPLGRAVIAALSEVAPEVVSPEVRGRMEAMLKAIAEGAKDPEEVVQAVKKEFYTYLLRLKSAEEKIAPILLSAVKAVYQPSRGSPAPKSS